MMSHLFSFHPQDIRRLTYDQLLRYVAWVDKYIKAQSDGG